MLLITAFTVIIKPLLISIQDAVFREAYNGKGTEQLPFIFISASILSKLQSCKL